MERHNEWVTVARNRDRVKIPWRSRQLLLERLREVEPARGIVQAFVDVGVSSPVELSGDDVVWLLGFLDRWADAVDVHELPAGIWDLRNMLADDVAT